MVSCGSASPSACQPGAQPAGAQPVSLPAWGPTRWGPTRSGAARSFSRGPELLRALPPARERLVGVLRAWLPQGGCHLLAVQLSSRVCRCLQDSYNTQRRDDMIRAADLHSCVRAAVDSWSTTKPIETLYTSPFPTSLDPVKVRHDRELT